MEGINRIKMEVKSVSENTVEYAYDVKGDWKKYFRLENTFRISYNIDISDVPNSVLIIPFLCDVLPMAWLCDAEIYTESLDWDFYAHIEEARQGYRKMYPMLSFRGRLIAERMKSRSHLCADKRAACFFSGGVDAYTTLFRHLEERPVLITVWGADITLLDEEGWQKAFSHTKMVAKEFALDAVSVKSSFREIMNEDALSELVRESGDGWWHGFLHGIALIGHAAPIAYACGLQSIYIASSYPEKMKGSYTCASDPSIDSHVQFCGCHTVHDGYQMDRQEKVRYLVSQKEALGRAFQLRVCWESAGGGNCCHCEKCYRTILEIVSEGGNPNECGFQWGEKERKRCRREMRHKIVLPQPNINQYYPAIQEAMKRNKDKIEGQESYNWLLKMDFDTFNDRPVKKLRRTVFVRKIGKALRRLARQ